MGIELPEAARGAPTRGDPAEIEEEKYRHSGHLESIVAEVLKRNQRKNSGRPARTH